MLKLFKKRRLLQWDELCLIRKQREICRGGRFFYAFLCVLQVIFRLAEIVLIPKLIYLCFTGEMINVFPWMGILAGIIMMDIGMSGIAGNILARVQEVIHGELLYSIYKSILDTEWEALRSFRDGDLAERLDYDVRKVSEAAAGWDAMFLAEILRFLGVLWLLFQLDYLLVVVVFVCCPVSVLISERMMKNIRRSRKGCQEAERNLLFFHSESVNQLGMIQAFDMQEVFRERIMELRKKIKKSFVEFRQEELLYQFLQSLTGTITVILCFGCGILRLNHDLSGVSSLFLLWILMGQVKDTFQKMLQTASGMAEAVISAGRLLELAELPEEVKLDVEWTEFLRMRKKDGISIVFEHVDFCYRSGEVILEQVSLEAHPGEWVGIAGGSGEGKTTLLRLLLGLILPTDGVLKLSHKQGLNCLVSAATRPFIAYVPQENSIFPGTVADNLRLGRMGASEDELWEALEIACAADFVKELPQGLKTFIGTQGIHLSEGQAQRLAIARAVVRDAPICLLDEATSALEPELERRVLSNLKQVWRQKTCIITSHRIHILGRCDRVYRIEETGISPAGECFEEDEWGTRWEDVPYRLTELVELFAVGG